MYRPSYSHENKALKNTRGESKCPALFKVERVEKGFIVDEEWIVRRPSTYR